MNHAMYEKNKEAFLNNGPDSWWAKDALEAELAELRNIQFLNDVGQKRLAEIIQMLET